MKTKEEIKKGLRACVVEGDCDGCPYGKKHSEDSYCWDKMYEDVLSLIDDKEGGQE